jgi:hypothetical protein
LSTSGLIPETPGKLLAIRPDHDFFTATSIAARTISSATAPAEQRLGSVGQYNDQASPFLLFRHHLHRQDKPQAAVIRWGEVGHRLQVLAIAAAARNKVALLNA